MEVKIVKTKSKRRKEFYDKEWKIADGEHYEISTNWKEKKYYLEVYEGKEIVGILSMTICAKVAKINNLIVSHKKRGLGIGKELMLEAEKIAKKEDSHKIYLSTGKGWSAEKFYETLGYKKEGLLKKHYFKKDFVLFGKQL